MSIQIRTFRIAQDSQESPSELNQFLENKIVRHWGSTYDPQTREWNLLLAFEEREQRERLPQREARSNERPNRNQPRPERTERKPKPERQEQVIDVPEADMPLYEAIRKWRNGVAREANIKPFNIFNNRQLEQLVKAKPGDREQLRSIVPDMSQAQFDQHSDELLGFIQGSNMNVTANVE